MKKRKLIIDCDPGFDDTLSLLMLYKHIDKFDIQLICSSAGNTPIELTTRNIQWLAKNFFPGVKVAKGASEALMKTFNRNAEDVHGIAGLGDFVPAEQDYPYDEDSVEAMYKILKSNEEPITLVTLGPLTNIARLFKKYPSAKKKISEIYSMVGSNTGSGNIYPYAEFNSWFDAEALDIVVKSKIPITFNSLELSEFSRFPREEFLDRDAETLCQSLLMEIMEGVTEIKDKNSYFLYDINTVCALIKPDLYDYIPCDVTVSTNPSTYGKTQMTYNPKGIHTYMSIKDNNRLKSFILENIFSL